MQNILRMITAALITALLLNLFLSSAFAHRMIIEPVEDGIIMVAYEDGRFSRRTEVYIYGHEGEVLYSGKLDDKGYFHYPSDLDAALIVADDGLGHRAEWHGGNSYGPELPRTATVAIVVMFFCFIAVFFHLRIKKRNIQYR